MEREKTHKYFGSFRVITRIVLSLVAVVLLFSFLCSRKERISNTSVGTSQTTDSIKSVKVVAYPGKWTVVEVDKYYNGRWIKDAKAGIDNVKRLVKVRFNRKVTKEERITKDGNIVEVNYNHDEVIRLIEFQSMEDKPVYLIVEFIKKQ